MLNPGTSLKTTAPNLEPSTTQPLDQYSIWTDEVKECQIKNEQVRHWFEDILPIDDFIARGMWKYFGKIWRDEQENLPRKMLGALVPISRKPVRTAVHSWKL